MRVRYLVILPALAAVLAVVFGVVYFWDLGQFFDSEAAATADEGTASKTADGQQPMVQIGRGGKPIKRRKPFNPDLMQVAVATARQGQVPVFLSGLGTVIAYNTVDTKAEVDGIIVKMNFKEGDDVKAGDALVTIDPTPYQARLEQWQAAKARAEAQLENAKTNLWRDQQLVAHNFATQKQTDEESALVGKFTADVAEAEAQIKFAQVELDHTIIRSSIDGRTGIRHVDPGNYVRAANNTNIVTVVQLQPISVLVSVASRDLIQTGATPGQSNLPILAYSQDGTTLLDRGQLQTVNNVIYTTSGTIQLKANFPNEQYRLWPGDYVFCKIVVENRHNGITVPSAAIRHGALGDFVWIARPDNTAETKRVKVKQTVGDTTLIDKGIEPGERVVVEGQYHLQPGSHLQIVSKDAE
jgi:membrane fusion protein, multidrug efflux system